MVTLLHVDSRGLKRTHGAVITLPSQLAVFLDSDHSPGAAESWLSIVSQGRCQRHHAALETSHTSNIVGGQLARAREREWDVFIFYHSKTFI